MLRSTFIVFITGWIAWFALDKPRPGPAAFPRASDQLLDNFQLAFDMLQAGEWEYAFIFIWHAHYLVLSLLGGALLAMLFGSVSEYLGRRHRLVVPERSEKQRQGEKILRRSRNQLRRGRNSLVRDHRIQGLGFFDPVADSLF